MWKRNLAKYGLAVGVLALGWLLGAEQKDAAPKDVAPKAVSAQAVAQKAVSAQAAAPKAAPTQTVSPQAVSSEAAASAAAASQAAAPKAAVVVRDGEYCDKERVAAYIAMFRTLPKNYITKAEARELGWQGGPLEPFAPGKSIGGDRFGNYERKLPNGRYKECDIDTRGKPRGVKRLIYSTDGKAIYYTGDHYETFEEVVAR